MSGENIYNLLQEGPSEKEVVYTGKYEKHMKEMSKPAYSTFYEKGKEYDATHPRYFKQRDAVIGTIVNDTVDPKNFLRVGKGVKHIVAPLHQRRLFTKPPLDDGLRRHREGVDKEGAATGPVVYPGDKGDGGRHLSHDCVAGDRLSVEKKDASSGKEGGADAATDDAGNQIYVEGEGRTCHPDFSKGQLKDGNGHWETRSGLTGTKENNALQHAEVTENVYGCSTLEGKKDFITSNKLEVSNMVPKRRKDQPEHPTCWKTFGRVPIYLGRVKQEIDDDKKRLKSIEEFQTQQQLQQMKKYVYRLDEMERVELLGKLRTQLNQKTTELNQMPFSKDTFTQVMRRSELEKDIREIETSILKLDKDAVFIYNSDPRCVHWTKNAAMKEATCFASQ